MLSTKFRFNHRHSISGSNQGKRAPDQHLDIKTEWSAIGAFVSDRIKKSATGQSRDHIQRAGRVIIGLHHSLQKSRLV